MTLNPIVYGPTSTAIVARYNAAPAKVSKYWSYEEVTPVRGEIKQHYIKEQKYLCCYCGIPDPSKHGADWDVEHVVSQKRRPEFLFTQVNLGVACKECNGNKSDKETLVKPLAAPYPMTSDAFLVVHPHFDEWSDHILRDHLTYASFTEKGKWTIEECKLNRFSERVIGLRYAISDTRYEDLVRSLLAGGSTLQQIANHIRISLPSEAELRSDDQGAS